MLEKIKSDMDFGDYIRLNDAIDEAVAFETLKDAMDKKARPTQLCFYLDEEKTQLNTVMYLNTGDYYGSEIIY